MHAAKADVTRASLQVALLYLLAEQVKAQSAPPHSEASEQEPEERLTEVEAIEPTADQSQEELDPEQAAAQLRALIDEELAITAQARGIDPELRLAMEQEAQSAQTQLSSPNTLQANAGSQGAAKGFEWADLKIGESGLSPFVVMGGGFLFNSLLAGSGPAAVVAKAVLYANGIVADGYISGSTVKLLDANGKVIASTATDASGRYTFDDALLKQASKVVASGGVDTSTGLKFEIELSAPSGATVINPLTTLVQSFIEANPGMSAAKAMQAVRTALGIPDSQDLLTLDPIAAATSGTAEQKSLALALQIKAAQVANLLVTASSAMRASDPGLSLQDAMGKIIGGLTQQIANVASGAQKPFALNDVSIITSVTGLSGDAVSLIAEGNSFSADSLDGIYEFQKLVQDDLSNILSLGGTMSAEALKSLTALLKFVSQGNKVVDFKLAPSSDTSLNGSALLTHVADPSVRIDLKPLVNTVKVGDTIQLTQEGREPTTVTVTPQDLARGYVDIKLPTFTQDGSATITVTVTDSQTQKPVASGVAAITYDSTVSAISAQIAPHTDPVGGEGKPNVMVTVTGLEAGAVWQYSLDNGKTWSAQISGPSTPVAAPQGAFVLTLRQIDKAGNESAPSQITFEYSAGNFAPALTGAKAVLVDGVEDRSTIIKASDLLKGYSDAENQKLSIVNLTAKGDAGLVIQVVANNDGTYTLTAPANYNGAVVLGYGVSDGVAVISASQQLSITAVNDAAVLSSAVVALDETNEALSTSGKLTVTDVDSAETFQVQTNVAGTHGKFSIDAQGNWTYVANTALNSLNVGDSVSDTFTVESADGTQTSVKVTINGTNDLPTLTSQVAILSAGFEDTVYTFTAAQLLQGYSDVDGGTLSVSNVSATHGSITADGQGNYRFTPEANYNGPVALSYTINDGQGGNTAVVQSFSLSTSNDVPALTGTKANLAAGTEDQSYLIRTADLLAGYSDADQGTLSVTELLADQGLITDNHNGTFTFTPAANYNGTVTLSYIIADGQGGHTAATQSLNLASVNDAPELSGETADLRNGQEGQAYEVTAADLLKGYTDVEGDALSVAALSANHGSVKDNGDGTYTITPDAGYAGLVTLSYKVVDAQGAQTVATQSFGLTANNVAPALTGTPANLAAGQEDSAYTVRVQDLLTGYSDQDGGTLAVENLRVDHGQVQLTAPGVYTITPDANYNGTLTLSYKVVDGQGGRTNATQTVKIDSVNDAPALTSLPAILAAGTEDQAYQVTAAQLLQGYSDVDADALSVGALSADHGSVTDNGDGTYTITPDANYNGPVTLTYLVRDGHGAETSVSQSFSLSSVNDAPALTSQALILSAGFEDTVYTFTAAQLLQGYSDVDGGTLSVSNVTATHGSITTDGQGNYRFTPDANYNGPVALSYTINDGQGGNTAVVQSFSLSAVNDAPRLIADTLRIKEGSSQNSFNLLTNDSDAEGSALSISGISNANQDAVSFDAVLNVFRIVTSHGVLTLGVNGSYSYAANGAATAALNAGEKFTEIFTYTVTDGATTSTSTLKVTIDGASTVIDGYVQNATVFYDLNNNQIQDEGEATATTDEFGRYSVSVDTPLSGGRWVSTGGTDSFSGEEVGYLFAPAGSSVITPLTTLLAFATDAQRATIEANILKVLGLDTLLADAGIAGVTSFDPIAAIVSPMNGANLSALQQAGAAVFASQQVIMTLMQTAIKLGSVDIVVQGIQTSFENLANEIALGGMDGAETAQGRLALLHALNQKVISAIVAQSTTIPDSLKADLTQSVSGMLNHVTGALLANFEALALQLYKSAQGLELLLDDQLYIALAKATVASAQTSLLDAISEVLKSENPLQLAAGFVTEFDTQIENSANGSVDLPVPGNLLSVAAAKAYIARGVDVSGRTLDASSITMADYQSLHKAAGLLLTDGVEINVTDSGVIGYSDEIDSFRGDRGLDAVLNLGGSADVAVTIDETQALGLIDAGLQFATGDTITLNADNAEGTHLGASLKQLSKLGVDTVALGAAGTELSFGEGALIGTLPSFSSNGKVTLNVNGQEQLGQAAAAAGALDAAGIDTVQINLATDYLSSVNDQASLDVLSDDLRALLSGGLDVEFASGVTVLDMQEQVSLSGDQATALIHSGIQFAADDFVTLHLGSNAEATHLQSSLKDLQKLGVDAITVADGVTALTLNADGAQLSNEWGSSVLSIQATDANVNLSFSGSDSFGSFANQAAFDNFRLADVGVDQITVALQDQGQGGYSADVLHIANGLMNFGNNEGVQVVMDAAGSSSVQVDLGGTNISQLINNGLSFASNDQVSIDAQTDGTHLSTSLRDLQKLGIDAVNTAGLTLEGQTSALHLNLGEADIVAGSLTAIGDNNNDGVLSHEELSALQVNLTLQSVDEVLQMKDIAAGLHQQTGIDAVEFDLTYQGADRVADIVSGLNAMAAEGLAMHAAVDGTQASALIEQGFSFAQADQVVVTHDYVQGTHLGSSLKDLQKLGVDAVAVSGGVTVALGDGPWGNTALPAIGDIDMNGVLSREERDSTSVTLETRLTDLGDVLGHATDLVNQAGVDAISLNIAGRDLDTLSNLLSAQAGTLSALDAAGLTVNAINVDGANDASVNIDQGLAETLIHAGLHFAADDQIDVHATGTYIQSSLKDLQKLGVDAVSLNASAVADITDGSIPNFSSATIDLGLSVSLDVATADQLHALSSLSQDILTDGAYNSLRDLSGIQSIELVGDSSALETMLSTADGSLTRTLAEVQTLRSEGFELTTIDVAGALQTASLTINDDQAAALVAAGLHFAAADHITVDAASGTHMQTSLRDLQKLGVDAVSAAGSTLDLDLGHSDFGGLNGMPNLGGAEVDVTLHADFWNLPGFLNSAGQESTDIQALGIDHVQLNYGTDHYYGLVDILSSLGADAYSGQIQSGSPLDVLSKSAVDLQLNGKYYDVNTSAYVEQAQVNVNAAVSQLIEAGLHFAQEDHVHLSGLHNADGTHITTSLKDLQKLGVDVVNSMPAVGMNIDLGTSGTLNAQGIPSFDKSLDISLSLAPSQNLSEIQDVAWALADAGIDHITLSQDQMLADEAATQALINAGFDFNVLVGSAPAVANTPDTLDDIFNIVKNGVDVLGNMLTQNASMGELVTSLGDAGIHRIDVDKPAHVSIGDDLAAALYEAGMLTALPEAGVEINAGAAMQLQTSLSAMANLGVDHVLAQQGAQVNLGAQFSESELANLLGHFVDEGPQGGIKPIFDHGAELNMGQTNGFTEETLQSLLQSGMGSQLHDLGISKVVAQVETPVGVIGNFGYENMEFDLDAFHKKPGQA